MLRQSHSNESRAWTPLPGHICQLLGVSDWTGQTTPDFAGAGSQLLLLHAIAANFRSGENVALSSCCLFSGRVGLGLECWIQTFPVFRDVQIQGFFSTWLINKEQQRPD